MDDAGEGGPSDRVADADADADAGFDAFARRERRALVAFAWSLTGNVEAVERGVDVEYGIEGVGADDIDADSVYAIRVLQRPGVASAVDLIRYANDGAEVTTVRGQRAVMQTGESGLQEGDDPPVTLRTVTLQWLEPSGTLVEVYSVGVPRDQVVRFVESLRPADQGETEDLVSTYGIEHGTPVHPDAQPDDD